MTGEKLSNGCVLVLQTSQPILQHSFQKEERSYTTVADDLAIIIVTYNPFPPHPLNERVCIHAYVISNGQLPHNPIEC